jgi:hypothetical protein
MEKEKGGKRREGEGRQRKGRGKGQEEKGNGGEREEVEERRGKERRGEWSLVFPNEL